MKHCLYTPTKPFSKNSLTRKEPKPSEIKAFIKTPKNLQTSHAFVQLNLLIILYKTLVQFSSKRGFKPIYHNHFQEPRMANGQMKPVASLLLVLNFCMYAVVLGIAGWAMNFAIDHGFVIGPGLDLPAHFSPIYFPIGNAATGFFVVFALIAGVVGVASVLSGFNHIRQWNIDSLPAAASAAAIAWSLTLLAMGFAWKEIELNYRNAKLRTMEAFLIILSFTQLVYIAAIHGASSRR